MTKHTDNDNSALTPPWISDFPYITPFPLVPSPHHSIARVGRVINFRKRSTWCFLPWFTEMHLHYRHPPTPFIYEIRFVPVMWKIKEQRFIGITGSRENMTMKLCQFH